MHLTTINKTTMPKRSVEVLGEIEMREGKKRENLKITVDVMTRDFVLPNIGKYLTKLYPRTDNQLAIEIDVLRSLITGDLRGLYRRIRVNVSNVSPQVNRKE